MSKKRVAVICTVIIVFVLMITVAFSKNKNSAEQKIKSGAVEQNISQDVSFQAPEGNYSVKIVDVYETKPDTEELSPPKAQSVVVVVYEYTNNDMESGLVISDSHFKAYDIDGNELEVFPQNNLFEPGTIGTSGTHTASVAFAFNNNKKYIEVDYFNDVSSEKPDSVFTQEF